MAPCHVGRSRDRAAHGILRRRWLLGRHAGPVPARSSRSGRSRLAARCDDPGGSPCRLLLPAVWRRPSPCGRWSLLGGIPGAVAGAFVSRWVGGELLLLASGLVLVVVGSRIVRPIDPAAREQGGRRRMNRPLLVAATAGVGFFTGLLANGGGFLLVPLYVLVFGLRMRQAVGTSLVVISVLAVPTLATHRALVTSTGRRRDSSRSASSPRASRAVSSPGGPMARCCERLSAGS